MRMGKERGQKWNNCLGAKLETESKTRIRGDSTEEVLAHVGADRVSECEAPPLGGGLLGVTCF